MQKTSISARQIALFCACVLPAYKLVELPSLLSDFAKGGLLLPALLQFVLQFAVLGAVLYVIGSGKETLLSRLEKRLGKKLYIAYALYAPFFILFALLPILDLEKFTYAVFYDTAPTTFTFGVFFLLCAFIGCQTLKTVGRFGDVALFLFPISFFALIVMAFPACNFSALLPVTGVGGQTLLHTLKYTALPFTDVALLLPLLASLQYKKGDAKKICAGYGVGAFFTLLFLAVFYGTFSTTAWREHYAFTKIAQYFPALKVLGRLDLLFIYLICSVLFFYTSLPVLYAVRCVKGIFPRCSSAILSGGIAFALFLFALFCNKYYDGVYRFFGNALYPVFWVFGLLLPLALLLLQGDKTREKNASKK